MGTKAKITYIADHPGTPINIIIAKIICKAKFTKNINQVVVLERLKKKISPEKIAIIAPV